MQHRPDQTGPTLKDGEALDRLVDRAERWAKTYRRIDDDESQWEADYEAKFRPEAERLAAECTPRARAFAAVDWIMAVLVWLLVAGIVLGGSILLIRPSATWFWIFVGVAALIAVIGIGYVHYDTTSPARAEAKLEQKTEWLLGAAKRRAFADLRDRASERGGER